jgi:hypothetical protein
MLLWRERLLKKDKFPAGYTTEVDIQWKILDALKKRGFQLLEEEVRVPIEDPPRGLRFDFLMKRKGKKFAVELKIARGFADWFFHWLARSILTLQAVQRLKGIEPLLAVFVESLELGPVKRFKSQVALYAPSLWWLLADRRDNIAAHLPGGDEEDLDLSSNSESTAWLALPRKSGVHSSPFGYASEKLSFGDLHQWLFKVLLFAPRAESGWGGPRGSIRNLRQLATLAKVAPPLVYRWAAAMEHSGYLAKVGRVPVLRDLDALLAEWRGRYRINDNHLTPCDPVFHVPLDDRFQEEFLERLRQLKKKSLSYALSGHQACRVYRLRHSDARSVHVYMAGDLAGALEALQLVPSNNPAAPIRLLRPKHARSVFGGVTPVDGVQVCDLLQVYLDLYHLPDRGREQAEFLRARALAPVLRAAAEPHHAISLGR